MTVLPTRQQLWLQTSQGEPKAPSSGFQAGEAGAWSQEGWQGFSWVLTGPHSSCPLLQKALPPGGTHRTWETPSKMGLPQVQSDGGLADIAQVF